MRPSDPSLSPITPYPDQFSWTDSVEAKWEQIKGSVRKQWGKLTDDDLAYVAGEREKLIGRLMDRYKLTRDQVEAQLSTWQQTLM
jgi:uncharacterized protein YjbJ (UPF0337 family)